MKTNERIAQQEKLDVKKIWFSYKDLDFVTRLGEWAHSKNSCEE